MKLQQKIWQKLMFENKTIEQIAEQENLTYVQCLTLAKQYMDMLHTKWQKSIKETTELTADEYWAKDFLQSNTLPIIVQKQYDRLYSLYKENQIYGGFLQTKDFFEVILKFPIVIYASLIKEQKKLSPAKEAILASIVSTTLSFGDWEQIAENIGKIKEVNDNFEKQLISLLAYTAKFTKNNGIVNWRNETIGHGALSLLDDQHFIAMLQQRLQNIKDYLMHEKVQATYAVIQLQEQNKHWYVTANEVERKIAVAPLIQSNEEQNEQFFIFDSFYSRVHKIAYLNYFSGKKALINDEEILRLYSKYTTNKRLLQQIPAPQQEHLIVLDRTLENELLKDIRQTYVPPKHLIRWLENILTMETKGIFHLTMEEGMGKTTFSQAMDELMFNKIKRSIDGKNSPILNSCVRKVFYCQNPLLQEDVANHTKGEQNTGERSSTQLKYYFNRIFNHYLHDQREVIIEGFTPFLFEEEWTANSFYSILAEYAAIYKARAEKEKLLLIIDGLDELADQKRATLLSFLLNEALVPNGVYIVFTSRKVPNKTYVTINSTREKICLKDDAENIEQLQLFLKEHVTKDKELQQKIIFEDQNKTLLQLQPLADLKKLTFELHDTSFAHVVKAYFQNLLNTYSETYSEPLVQLIAVLSKSTMPLSVPQMNYLLNNSQFDAQIYGYLRDLRGFLTTSFVDDIKVFEFRSSEIKESFLQIDAVATALDEIEQDIYSTICSEQWFVNADDAVKFLFVNPPVEDLQYQQNLYSTCKTMFYNATSLYQLQLAKLLYKRLFSTVEGMKDMYFPLAMLDNGEMEMINGDFRNAVIAFEVSGLPFMKSTVKEQQLFFLKAALLSIWANENYKTYSDKNSSYASMLYYGPMDEITEQYAHKKNRNVAIACMSRDLYVDRNLIVTHLCILFYPFITDTPFRLVAFTRRTNNSYSIGRDMNDFHNSHVHLV